MGLQPDSLDDLAVTQEETSWTDDLDNCAHTGMNFSVIVYEGWSRSE